MKIINKSMYALLSVMLLSVFLGCEKSSQKQSEKQSGLLMESISFRDIPGLTQDEIKAIEALQKQNTPFIYGVTPSTEAFIKKNGEIGGYTVLLCNWLTDLFGIKFQPEIYSNWGNLLEKLHNGEISFINLKNTEERQKFYQMTEPIAQRSIKIIRLENGPISKNSALPRFAFIGGTGTYQDIIATLVPGSYETVLVNDYAAAYYMMKNGEVDAFIELNVMEEAFDQYSDVFVEDFFPMLFNQVSMAAENSALMPVVSVINKALRNGAFQQLVQLYNNGYKDYLTHKLSMRLTEEESEFIKKQPVIKIGAQSYNYPVDFYNIYEKEWQGITFDVLKEVSALTGLSFEVATNINIEWSDLLQKLESGEVSFIPELINSAEWENRFIWPQTVIMKDQYILISKSDFPKLKANDILGVRVGLVKNYASNALFHRWFPDHPYITEYESFEATIVALMRGEIDVTMCSFRNFLAIANYQERVGFKANFLFNYVYDVSPGFNKNETVLLSIMDKAIQLTDVNKISEQWMRKTYDYRAQVLQAQRLWLVIAIILSLSMIVLIFLLLKRTLSEEKRLEKLVARQTSMLNAIFNSSKDHIFCKGLDSLYIRCNKSMEDFFGIREADIIGKNDMAEALKIPKEIADGFMKEDKEVISKGQPIVFEGKVSSKSGSIFIETVKSPIIQNNEIVGIVGIARDITKRKTVEEEIRAASQAKSMFLANMSHEMRTPMNVMVGLTNLMLEEDEPSVNLKDNLKKLGVAGNAMLGLIGNVLDISKIEAGKFELALAQYEMPSFLNDIIVLNTMFIEKKSITFKLDISEKLPYKLYGDDLRVKQIISNLLSNAFKYTRNGTVTLGVSCERENSENVWMSVYVSDTGIGISKENQKKLFTDYGKVDIRTNSESKSTDLGLSITKMLIEQMNGEISVESDYGKGSTFRFRIRQGYVSDYAIGAEIVENLRSFRYLDTKKQAHEKLSRPDLSYASVLIVDDMQTNLDVAAALLRKYKMQVDCVTSGQDAVDRIANGEPVYNAIFMDYMMPGMNGMEATGKIRALGTKYAETVPIIALTANVIAGNENMFLSNGFQAFLTKPINVMNLDSVVQRWVRDKPRE